MDQSSEAELQKSMNALFLAADSSVVEHHNALTMKVINELKEKYKRAGEEIANLAHPEFGEMGRLQEEIHELKKELEWLKFYKREVYQCLGAGVDDVNKELRDAYVKKMGLGGVPEKLRKEYLDYEADHREGG
jgi:hypothetical protein